MKFESQIEHRDSGTNSANAASFSGRKLVVLMFLFGLTATTTMWIYWTLHLGPFMPLQQALAAEFEKSSPRVSGGQRKISKNTPRILRVVMRVPFDPTGADRDAQSQVEHVLQRTRDIAGRHVSLDDYEILEVHLFREQAKPDGNEIRSEVFRRNPETWTRVDEAGNDQ